jgi:hypothetical protein
MRRLLLLAIPLLAVAMQAQTISTHVQPGYCTSSGPISHCGFVDENGVRGLVNSDYHGFYVDFALVEYALPPIAPDYTDLTAFDSYPVIAVQSESNGDGQTVTVILHGYRVNFQRGRTAVHTAYITSGTVTVSH